MLLKNGTPSGMNDPNTHFWTPDWEVINHPQSLQDSTNDQNPQLWNETWQASDINDESFGLELFVGFGTNESVTQNSAFVTCITVDITYYTIPTYGSSSSSAMATSEKRFSTSVIIGVVLAFVGLIAVSAAVYVFFIGKHRKKSGGSATPSGSDQTTPVNLTWRNSLDRNRRVSLPKTASGSETPPSRTSIVPSHTVWKQVASSKDWA